MAAAKSTTETLAASGVSAFKDAFEKQAAALADLNVHSKKNFDAVVASVTAASKGFEAVGAAAAAYSKKSFEDQVANAKSLAAAKSFQEAVELQTTFAKTSFEGYVAEMKKIAELVSSSVKDTVAPINERFTAVVEAVQAARPV